MKTRLLYSRSQFMLLMLVLLVAAATWFFGKRLQWPPEQTGIVVGAIIGLFANLAVGCWQSNDSSKQLEDATIRLHGATTSLEKVVNEVGSASANRDKGLEDLTKRIHKEVDNLRDASRKPLRNFAEILSKAQEMINESNLERLWMLSFTPCFGRIHAYNKRTLPDFYTPRDDNDKWGEDRIQDTSDAVRKRAEAFRGQIQMLALKSDVELRLATFPADIAYNEFFSRLKDRLYSTDPDETIAKIRKDHEDCLDVVLKAQDEKHRIEYVERLPLQMFITEVRRGAELEPRLACLVFFIGNETVEEVASGFYTRFPELVKLFERVFDNIVNANKATVRVARN